MQSPSLPPNFSDEVFNLELETEQPNVDIALINRLVELYAVINLLLKSFIYF